MITANNLHEAADIVGSFGRKDRRIGEYGLTLEELQRFISAAEFRDVEDRETITIDPMALAIGIMIGVIAENGKVQELARAVLSLAKDAGMPDSYQLTDKRMAIAREALAITEEENQDEGDLRGATES